MKQTLTSILLLIILLIGSDNIWAQNTPAVLHFPRFQIPGLVERPSFWKVRPEEITSIVRSVKKGTVKQIATTPLGLPVWAVIYGAPPAIQGTSTWPAGADSGNPESYYTHKNGPQVVMLTCCVHGAECESTAGTVNLITMLETGKDLSGYTDQHLLDLISKYRLIIIPCLNMDGRSVSPDHLKGVDDTTFVRASQGIWKNGNTIGYPQCKGHQPLPMDKVKHPGGYCNGLGYNLQYDVIPGHLQNEGKGLFDLAAAEQVDFMLNMHSHEMGPRVMGASQLAYPLHVQRVREYQKLVHDALEKEGLRPTPILPENSRSGINLDTEFTIVTGGLAMTFEQPTTADWTFEENLKITYKTIETILENGLKEPFAPRGVRNK
jgi:hypothetical protein